MILKKTILIANLFIAGITCITCQGQSLMDCNYSIMEAPKNNPIDCYEYEFQVGDRNGKLEFFNLNYIRKYTYGEQNKLEGWTENIKLYEQLDSLQGYFITKLDYNEEGNPISLTKYNYLEEIAYREQYSYEKDNEMLGELVNSVGDTWVRAFEFENCKIKKITEKNQEGEIMFITETINDFTKDKTVFFRNGSVKKVKRTVRTEKLKSDDHGNCIAYTEREDNKKHFKYVFRHYRYSEHENQEERTIKQVLDEFVNAFKKGDFAYLIDEMYLLREEAMLINQPYLGKKYLPGIQWVTLATDLAAKQGINTYLTKIRNRKKLDWDKIRLKKIIDKEVTQGGYGIGENIYSARYEISITDDNRSFTSVLSFMKLYNKWYIYLEK